MSLRSIWSLGFWKGQCRMGRCAQGFGHCLILQTSHSIYSRSAQENSAWPGLLEMVFEIVESWGGCHTISKIIRQPSSPERFFFFFLMIFQFWNRKLKTVKFILLDLPQMFHSNISSPVMKVKLTQGKWHLGNRNLAFPLSMGNADCWEDTHV